MTYDPTETDIIWMAGVLNTTTEGAILIFPSSGLIYKISHQRMTLTLQNPSILSDPKRRRLHEMTAVVAAFFMYETKEATQ